MSTSRLLRRAGTAVAAIALTAGLAACSGSDGDSGFTTTDVGAADVAEDAAAAPGDLATSEPASGDEGTVVDREVVTTGNVTLEADDPSATMREVSRLVDQAGGRIEHLSESPAADDRPGRVTATVRVPADRTTSAVDAFSGLGTVVDVTLDRTDVTGQGQDLDARISALTTSTGRLTELLASAGSTSALLEVERELASRQAELDSLRAQREALSDQVAMSTLHLDIRATPTPLAQQQGGFLGGLATGWNALVTTAQGAVLVLGVLLPWLAVAAVVFAVVRWILRRRRPAAPPAAPGGGTGGSAPAHDPAAPGAQDPDRKSELVG